MKRPFLYGLTLVFALTASLILVGETSLARKLLQDGRTMELIHGDVHGAISLYERAVHEAGNNAALRSEAMLRLAKAYKFDDQAKAQSILLKLTDEFPDRREAVEARSLLASLHPNNALLDKPAAGDVPELLDRPIWQDPQADLTGRVSFDRRYLSFVDRSHGGALAVHDLTTGKNRIVIDARSGQIGPSAISRLGKDIAYAWRPNGASNGELRVVGIDGSEDHHVFSNAELKSIYPMDWTPDGKIVVVLSKQDGVFQIATVDGRSQIQSLKVFLKAQEPANLSVSPDGRFIAFDAPQLEDSTRRDISVVGVDRGIVEYSVVKNPANDTVLGWATDSRLLFASDRGGKNGIWAIEIQNGRAANNLAIHLEDNVGDVRTLGMTRGNSLLYRSGSTQVRILENALPELARLQLASLQQPTQVNSPVMGSIEGVVVKRGTNEPIAGADVELTRLEGTKSSPLNPGAAEVFARLNDFASDTRLRVGPEPPAALAPELQYATTGDNGRFVFRNLKPGAYRLVAANYGGPFFPAKYGQRDPRGPGLVFPVAEGQTIREAKLEMAPLSVITGRVYDAMDRPLGHATVYSVTYVYQDGERVLMSSEKVLSNDHGEYRLFNLAPGRYFVAAKAQEQSELIYPPPNAYQETGGPPVVTRNALPNGSIVEESYGLVYHGDVMEANRAIAIDVGLGEFSVNGADIHMSAGLIPSSHIRGVLINSATGQPMPGIQVRAVPRRRAPHSLIPFSVTDSRGTFDLVGAVPGSYAVLTPPINLPAAGPRGEGPPPVPISANVAIEMGNRDLDNLRLVAGAPANLRGQIMIDGHTPNTPLPDLQKIRIALAWDPNVVGMPNPRSTFGAVPASAAVAADGTFLLAAPSGNFQLTVSGLSQDAYIKTIRMGAADILADGLRVNNDSDGRLEIVVTEAAGRLQGTTVNRSGDAMQNVVVALVPESPLLQGTRFYKSANSDARGKFDLHGIPPGNYRLFAWEYVEPGAWQDAQFMQPYQTLGKSVRITSEKNQDVQLTVIPVQR